MNTEVTIAFVFGVTFIVTLLVLAVRFPHPTAFQYNVFRIILSLAAAGAAAVVPGFLNVRLSTASSVLISAGGALAVFVVVFFFNPAQLAARVANEDIPVAAKPPKPPRKTRDGRPLGPDDKEAFFATWNALVALDRAGEQLWEHISDNTLEHFKRCRDEAEACIQKHALYFPEEAYRAIEEVMSAADFFFDGKLKLSDIHFELLREAAPAQANQDIFVGERIARQVKQNRRWLTRYRNLLHDLRTSLHSHMAG